MLAIDTAERNHGAMSEVGGCCALERDDRGALRELAGDLGKGMPARERVVCSVNPP
jgi:hypothetical protein